MPPAVVATPPPNIARAERIKLALIKVIKSAGKNSDIKPVVVKNEKTQIQFLKLNKKLLLLNRKRWLNLDEILDQEVIQNTSF